MIDGIIKKLLALPKLDISPESLKLFLAHTNRLIFHGQPISLASFKSGWTAEPEPSIFVRDMEAIERYLTAWEALMEDMVKLTRLIKIGWESMHDKQIGADDLVPLFIAIFSQTHADLSLLHEKLALARDVNESDYFINLLYSACEYLRDGGDIIQDDIQSCLPIIRDLSMSDGLVMLKLEKQLRLLCTAKMNEYADDIYASLKIHQVDTYQFDDANMDKAQIKETRTGKIIEMYTGVKDHPFTSYPELGEDVKKFIAYYEFSISLKRTNTNNVFERLREFTYKFQQFENQLGHDLTNTRIDISEDCKVYLGIPDDKRLSVLLLIWTPPQGATLQLQQFMHHLTKKISTIENTLDTRTQPTTTASAAKLA